MKNSFTLIELLVVVAFTVILAAMLFPAIAKAREKGRATVCLDNIKRMALENHKYQAAYDNYCISSYMQVEKDTWSQFPFQLYLVRKENVDPKTLECPSCPVKSAECLTRDGHYDWTAEKKVSYGINFGSFGRNSVGNGDENNDTELYHQRQTSELESKGGNLSKLVWVIESTPTSMCDEILGHSRNGGNSCMVQFGDVYPNMMTGKSFYPSRFQHFGKANLGFSDGHAASSKPTECISWLNGQADPNNQVARYYWFPRFDKSTNELVMYNPY